jgi:hypothetical protein
MNTTVAQKIDELLDQLDSLKSMVGLFYSFKQFTIYKQIAGILRLLLVGSSGQAGLVSDVLPAARFLPLVKVPDPAMEPGFILLPARVRIIVGDADVTMGNGDSLVKEIIVAGSAVASMEWQDLFDPDGTPLILSDWLMQKFLQPGRTLKQFISLIGNKDGGAHFDPNQNIVALQKCGNIHSHLISGIAKAVHPQILAQIGDAFPNHSRHVR